MKIVHTTRPSGFLPKFEIVSCFVRANGRILLLLRQDHKPQGNTWGVPAGKKSDNETIFDALVREIYEETGQEFSFDHSDFHSTVFVHYPDYDFVYHIFHKNMPRIVNIVISDKEHKDFKWVKPEEALRMPLIGGLNECIRLVYG